jgi:hypothetical protein
LVTIIRKSIFLFLGLSWVTAPALASGEGSEPTPEFLDAAFSAQDAARVAAGFSDTAPVETPGNPLADMAAAADLVFLGTVSAQAYRYDERGTPSTHTTFSISRRLRGEHVPGEITLVQRGGPSRSGDRILMVSDARYFNVGEDEVLFVDLDPGNPLAALRTRVLNRFRIYEGRVYDEDGYGVTFIPMGGGAYRLELSAARSLAQRFWRIHIGSHWLEKRFEDEGETSPDSTGAVAVAAQESLRTGDQPVPPEALHVDTFSALIEAAGE